jgi:hypothetical protein
MLWSAFPVFQHCHGGVNVQVVTILETSSLEKIEILPDDLRTDNTRLC